MKITERFARAVAAGLMPDDENISGRIVFTEGKRTIILFNESKEIYRVEELWNSSNTIVGNDVQLRSNDKDLYSLEWRKPTESDVGKMCWFWDKSIDVILFGACELNQDEDYEECEFALTCNDFHEPYKYCLLAEHNQIAPTEADFKRIYGEQL